MKAIKEEGCLPLFRRFRRGGCIAAWGIGCLAAGTTLAAAVINDPVAYWSFDDAGSLLSNQVTSSPYHDASALFGQPASGVADGASGIVGNALMLDGATGIRLPYHQDNLGTSFTLEFLGVQNSTGENEGYGMDRLQLTVFPLRGTLISLL